MLVKQHGSSLLCTSRPPMRMRSAPPAGNKRSSLQHSSARGSVPRPGTVRTQVVATKTTQSAMSGDKPKGSINLAQWLVNGKGEGEVTATLEDVSKGSVEFWKIYRAPYVEQVNKARAEHEAALQEAEKNGKEVSESREAFTPPCCKQVDNTPEYAAHPAATEIIKYGEMVQAVYDTLQTKDVYSRFFGRCIAGALKPGSTLQENKDKQYILVSKEAAQYKVREQMEADSGAYRLVIKEGRNYVGFIAEGPADSANPNNGEVDIAVVFRGTITQDEWVQDAKVIQVRWNKGSLTAPYPRIFLRAVPFMPSTNWAVGSFLVSLISLNILSAAKGATLPKLADKVAAVAAAPGTTGQEGLLGGALHILLAGVDSILDNAVGLLGALASPVLGIAETVGAAIGEVLLPFLGVSGGSDVLGFSLLLAANVWVVSGIVRAVLAHPTHWLKDVQSVILGAGPWAWWAVQLVGDTLKSSLFGAFRGDPLVSYGFKQMYADAKESTDEKVMPASPRLTIMKTLADMLEEYQARGKKVRSIHVTGHSLGGALASLCGYDLGQTIAEAVASEDGNFPTPTKATTTDLYSKTAAERARFMKAIHKLQASNAELVPVVAAITFAAPRVGNPSYANTFKARSLINPLWVAEPLFNDKYTCGGKLAQLGVIFRDRLNLLSKRIAYGAGVGDIKSDGKALSARGKVYGGMLRVVNVHDIVPDLPSALRLPFYSYVHGGQELLLNSLFVPYYKAEDFTGAAIGARHNMEQYMHTLYPVRDMSLVNKSDDCLTAGHRIPNSWWNPIPNRGMVQDKKTGRWVRGEDMKPN